jgi:uncharacterized protein
MKEMVSRAQLQPVATGRVYQQEYVIFLRSQGERIVWLRENFDPVRAARAMDIPTF